MADLSKLKLSNDSIEMPLCSPVDGAKLEGIKLFVIGQDSKEFQTKVRALKQKAIKKAPKGDLSKLNAEDDEEIALQIIACSLTGWDGIEENGKTLEYNEDNAVYLLKEYPWVRDQIKEYISDRANFIKG